MSDLAATNCGCGCGNDGGNNNCLFLILILLFCGGCVMAVETMVSSVEMTAVQA